MICDCCKKEETVIQIAGVGHFCLKCNNDRMLQIMGIQNDFDYQEKICIYEKAGNLRQFELHHIILGGIVSWEATEIGGSYHIKDISHIDDNTAAVISRFYKKIVTTVQSKTIEKRTDHMFNNLLIRERTCYSMKQKGNIGIEEDEHGNVYFVIDGEAFIPNEFARMLGSYVGFTMQYQIHDASEPVLADNELLKATEVGKEYLLEELQRKIAMYSDGPGFISYKDVSNFEEAIGDIIDRLELMYDSFNRDEARETGDELIKMLEALETDDDFFPEYIINVIRGVLDE